MTQPVLIPTDAQEKLAGFVLVALALPVGKVLWSTQAMPKVARPYVELTPLSNNQIGSSDIRTRDEVLGSGHPFEIDTQWEATVSVTIRADDHADRAILLRQYLESPAATLYRHTNRIGITRGPSGIIDVTADLDTEREGRSDVPLIYRFHTILDQEVAGIDTVEATPQVT